MKLLQSKLQYLKENRALIGLKAGTEVEAMNFKEIALMRNISHNIVSLTVKIGGPEARNDIENIYEIGVDAVLAPMIESAYGLKNFVSVINENEKYKKFKLSINLETICSYNNLAEIFLSPSMQFIDRINVGRSDLSASMGLTADDPQVYAITKNIVEMAKSLNKKTSIGGKIDTENVNMIKDIIAPDFISTRHMIVSAKTVDISLAIEEALNWEIDFYKYLVLHNPPRQEFYNKQIQSITKRLALAVV